MRQRVCPGTRRGCDREAETAQIVVLVVVAVPTAVILSEVEGQQGAAGIRDWSLSQEDRFARLIAQPRPYVDSPSRLFLAVDGELDGTGHASLAALVVENGLERRFRRIHVGRGFREFDLGHLVGRIGRRSFHFKLSQRAGSLDRAARTAQRQVRIVQQLEPKRRDSLEGGAHRHLHAMLGRRVALRQEGAVLHRQVLLAAV